MIYPIKKAYEKTRDKRILLIYKKMRVLHPIIGALIIIIGLIHGYMGLGTLLRLHTGSFVIITLIIMGLIAVTGPKVKPLRKKWRFIHRNIGLVLLIFILIHVFYRNLI